MKAPGNGVPDVAQITNQTINYPRQVFLWSFKEKKDRRSEFLFVSRPRKLGRAFFFFRCRSIFSAAETFPPLKLVDLSLERNDYKKNRRRQWRLLPRTAKVTCQLFGSPGPLPWPCRKAKGEVL